MASKNPIYALMWLVLLVFLAWPLAGFLTVVRLTYSSMNAVISICLHQPFNTVLFILQIWVVLQPFEPLFGFIKDINSTVEKYITWPRECGKAIWNCSNRCPQPQVASSRSVLVFQQLNKERSVVGDILSMSVCQQILDRLKNATEN